MGGRSFIAFVFACVSQLLLASCGYQLGGTKPPSLDFAKTAMVCLFANNSLEPRAGTLVTGSVADELQRDGTYKLTTRNQADILIEGDVHSVSFEQLRSSRDDTYKSLESGLRLVVNYRVIDGKSNKVLYSGTAQEVATFFDSGNIQTARTNALSYAARLVGTAIAENLTNG